MSNKIDDVPAFVRLTDTEVLFLSLLRNISKGIPPELLESTRFSAREIDEAIATRQLSQEGMLAAAYFGYLPFWTNFKQFQAHAKRINNYGENPDWQRLQADEIARENSAAAEYGLSRGEVKRLFKKLNEMAEESGFESLEDIFGPREPEQLSSWNAESTAISVSTLASGPRYLRDIAKAVLSDSPANFVMKTVGGWVLMLHLEDENAFAMAWPIAGLRIGGYRFNGFIDEVSMKWSWVTESPLFYAPEEVLTELRALAQLHCPDHEFVEQEAPSALDAWQTWTLTQAAFSREG